MDSTSASTSGGRPVSGELVISTLKYVNNIHSFILLPSIVLSFIQLIYISILISFLKMYDMREKLLPDQRVRAIQEELAGFLLREVLDPAGHHYAEDEELNM